MVRLHNPFIFRIFTSTVAARSRRVYSGAMTLIVFLADPIDFLTGGSSGCSDRVRVWNGVGRFIPYAGFDLPVPINRAVRVDSTGVLMNQATSGDSLGWARYLSTALYGCVSALYSGVWWVLPAVAPYVLPVVVVGLSASVFYSMAHINYESLVMLKSTYAVFGEYWVEHDDMSTIQNPRPYADERIFKAIRKVGEKRYSTMNTSTNLSINDLIDGLPFVDTALPNSRLDYTSYGDATVSFWLLFFIFSFIFVLLFFVFSYRLKRSDLFSSTSTYECGSDPMLSKSAVSMVPFFQTTVVYLIFELEIAVLFLVLPILSAVSVKTLISVTLFVLLIQLGTVFEIRGGISKWITK